MIVGWNGFHLDAGLLGSGEGATAVLPFVLETFGHGYILVDFLECPEVPGVASTLLVEDFDGLFKLVVGAKGHGASAVVRDDVLTATKGNVLAIEDVMLNSIKVNRVEVYLDIT